MSESSRNGVGSYSEIHTEGFRTPEAPSKQAHIERADSEGEGMIYCGHSRQEFSDYIEAVQGPEALEAFKAVCTLAEDVKAQGGRALLVGGSVRDEVLGVASKDFDIEVYGLEPEAILEIANRLGRVDEVGKAFGILKVTVTKGIDLDVSMPRRDSKIAKGHKGFAVTVDPSMTIKEAARRRDFTFNALCKDPLTGEIFDYFNGVNDLQSRILRVTDAEKFTEDPLRILRGAQFIGRFGLRCEPQSMELMRGMIDDLAELPTERIKKEFDKLLLKSIRPSMGFQMLFDVGVIEKYYPELLSLKSTPQEFSWHPEGDVWVHTLMVTDSAADVIRRHQLDDDSAVTVMYSALCHDLGKPATTTFNDDRIRSIGHEPAGEEPARKMLDRLGVPKEQVDAIVNVVRDHLWPSTAYLNIKKGELITDGAIRRLAKRIFPATIEELTYVCEADHLGRGPYLDQDHAKQFLLPEPYSAGKWLRERAVELGVNRETPKPLIQGRDLINLRFKPGRDFTTLIELANGLRDDKEMTREFILAQLATVATNPEAIALLTAL